MGGRGRVGERGVVVEQRVEPDVEDVLLVPGHGHAPGELVPREGHVAQAGADEGECLVVTGAGRDEVQLGVELFEALLEGGQAEKVVLLLLAGELDVVNGTEVALVDFVVGLEVGAAGAVPALVDALVDEAVLAHAAEHVLDDLHVLGVGCADEEVVAGAEHWCERLEALGVGVGELLRLDAFGAGGVGDGLTVLVCAG